MKPTITIDKYGNKYWFFNNEFHREDGPAVEFSNGTKQWYINGLAHREDGPAIEQADGTKEWYLNGELHRTDGPAVEYSDGTKQWYINDMRVYPEDNLIPIPQTEEEMLGVINYIYFVKIEGNLYFINQYIKKFKKEWYEKYRLLFEK